MNTSSTALADEFDADRIPTGAYARARPTASGVSWGAIAAGAAAAAALSLILLILGVGLGLSSVSPWAGDGIGANAFGLGTILWLTLTQVLASGAGGYLAGRLRSKWTDVQANEVYFRDTAHGFLAWAVASLATAGLLGSAIGSIVGGGVQAGAAVAGGAATTAMAAAGTAVGTATGAAETSSAMSYFTDALFRRDATASGASTVAAASAPAAAAPERSAAEDAAEITRIVGNAGRAQALPAADVRHIGQIVAQRSGLSQQDAEERVTTLHAQALSQLRETEVRARDAADKARRASAYGALWLFVSLLIGAFTASLAATFGGRQRDA
jgi:hypothetical protein